jgi:HrpA-like RNA helicase
VPQKVLDPPNADVIQDALDSLVQIHALVKPTSPRGRYEPTFYGCLLNSLPLSFDASVLALKFGEVGFLHEGILIGIMLDIQPLPILQPFGYQALVMFQSPHNRCFGPYAVSVICILFCVLQCKIFRDNYFYEDNKLKIGKKEATLIGNLCAFQFWQRMFKVHLILFVIILVHIFRIYCI